MIVPLRHIEVRLTILAYVEMRPRVLWVWWIQSDIDAEPVRFFDDGVSLLLRQIVVAPFLKGT